MNAYIPGLHCTPDAELVNRSTLSDDQLLMEIGRRLELMAVRLDKAEQATKEAWVQADDYESEADELRDRCDELTGALESAIMFLNGDLPDDADRLLKEFAELVNTTDCRPANPLPAAVSYCEAREGEFWRRLAGSIRKAQTMEGEA